MKRCIYLLLICSCLFGSAAIGQENKIREHAKKTTNMEGRAAAASSSQSVSVSMVKWGIALGIIIGVLCIVIKGSSSHAHQ